MIKLGETKKVVITRREPNFDMACYEVKHTVNMTFGIDDCGHSNKVIDWERSTCSLIIEFGKYINRGNEHEYTFWAHAEKSEED